MTPRFTTSGLAAGELLLTLAMILPILGRRRSPTLVFGFIAVVAMVQWLTGGQPMGSDLALLVAFCTVAAYEPFRSTVFCAIVLELGIVLAAARWSNGRSLAVLAPTLTRRTPGVQRRQDR